MSTPRTPRLRSAFPLSPRSPEQSKRPRSTAASTPIRSGPIISLDFLDGPTQRLYVAAIYFILLAWKLYDYFSLVAEQTNSLWFFMKWTAIDGVFLYSLPGLRIPWLEWSSFTVTFLFLGHAVVNAVLMFRIPIPFEGWLIAIGKVFFDSELAISERRVKANSLVQNSSLISGKQIIHILPEGTAFLNEQQKSFCLSDGQKSTQLPMHINQTIPTSIALWRIDLDTNEQEVLALSAKEVRRIRQEADKGFPKGDNTSPRVWQIPVKQTGLYRLKTVLDESNLEVQREQHDALVVQCPSASLKPEEQHRCRDELSNFFIEVDATPPIRIDYTRTINRGDESSISLTWHPDDMDSPLMSDSQSVHQQRQNKTEDLAWAKSRRHRISVNETMSTTGGWQYRIDRVQDGCGNIVDYSMSREMKDGLRTARTRHLEQDFVVHQRPKARLQGCTFEKPLRLPIGQSAALPVVLNPNNQGATKAARHQIRYSYQSTRDEFTSADESLPRQDKIAIISREGEGPSISEPGFYRLESIATEFCHGEILEPSGCMLVNPPQPDMSISWEEIPDKCAGHSVGILVNIDLVGSPPFKLRYSEQRRGGPLLHKSVDILSLRHQITFEPREAGHYTYSFHEISDSVYKHAKPLGAKGKGLRVEQDIKPTAWAYFDSRSASRATCLDQKATFTVILTGEGPWSLDYDLIHGKSRQKSRLEDVKSDRLEIETPPLTKGGSYSLTLTSITDQSGCKVFLDQEAKLEVRQERPSAGFAHVNGQRSVRGLEGQKTAIPIRLSGEGPWTVAYTRDGESGIHNQVFKTSNAVLEASSPGLYTLQSVSDNACPGLIDASAAVFQVDWIDRPSVSLQDREGIQHDSTGHIRDPVCEGGQDSVELSLVGNGPFQLEYQIHGRPAHGSQFTVNKKNTYASNIASIKMDTSKPGTFKYSVVGVSDQFYSMSKRKDLIFALDQKVNARPEASFANAGRYYSYCREDETATDTIPVNLVGKPPFMLEVGIKHQTSTKPEVVTYSAIKSNRYEIQVPKSSLSLGGYSISILRVIDDNDCQRVKDRNDRDIVHVTVVDVPSITPVETRTDYCIGDRISYALSGTPPFNVFYSFNNVARKAAVSGNDFRRLAEKPGVYTINAVSDRASTDACRARTNITKVVHELPSVRISKGKVKEVDIHEGGETQILFEFSGTPPFEFTYTRSTNAARGKRSIVLETRHDVSHEFSKSVRAFEEGTYEVVAIRDRYCGVALQGKNTGTSGQRVLS